MHQYGALGVATRMDLSPYAVLRIPVETAFLEYDRGEPSLVFLDARGVWCEHRLDGQTRSVLVVDVFSQHVTRAKTPRLEAPPKVVSRSNVFGKNSSPAP